MRTVGKSYWMGVACSSDQQKAAVRSWFAPLCDDMIPESAEILFDIETDREKRMKAVMVDKDGRRRVAIRTKGRNYSITLKAAEVA